tara:strand:- start:209 stop:427 length:219 start_codon:yes stop_codon:yes gene_type:complete
MNNITNNLIKLIMSKDKHPIYLSPYKPKLNRKCVKRKLIFCESYKIKTMCPEKLKLFLIKIDSNFFLNEKVF